MCYPQKKDSGPRAFRPHNLMFRSYVVVYLHLPKNIYFKTLVGLERKEITTGNMSISSWGLHQMEVWILVMIRSYWHLLAPFIAFLFWDPS